MMKIKLNANPASKQHPTAQWNRRTGRFLIKEIEAILKNKIESLRILISKGTLYKLFLEEI
jgi:hypothetical protein